MGVFCYTKKPKKSHVLHNFCSVMMEREEREGEVEGLINIVWLFFNGGRGKVWRNIKSHQKAYTNVSFECNT